MEFFKACCRSCFKNCQGYGCFENIVAEENVTDVYSLKKELPEGTFYWQLQSSADPSTKGPIRRFVVINDNYPVLLASSRRC